MKRGFTLIEVLVTMAIISILAGIMVPAVYKWWESQEVQTTKERLNTLKQAMIGDRNLVQNGIRTSYGFVGDNGELPFSNLSAHGGLKHLLDRPSSGYPKWNGPYMSGVDPATYAVDAWSREFRYSVRNDLDGYGNRYLSGEIRSAGRNGIFENDGDDVFVELDLREVAPSSRIQGNFAFTNLTGAGPHSALFEIKFRDPIDPSGELKLSSSCKSVFPNFTNFTTIIRDSATSVNLPIGKVTVTSKLFKNANCAEPSFRNSVDFDYFISDNLSRLLLNLPPVP